MSPPADEPVSVPAPDGEPNVRVCPYAGDWSAASEHPYAGAAGKSIDCTYDLLAFMAARQPAAPCLGWRPPAAPGAAPPAPGGPPDDTRPYQWWSYADVLKRATQLGSGLVKKYTLAKGAAVGFYAKNCPWWSVAMYACVSQGLVVVPIYDTLGANIVQYVSKHAELEVILVSADNCPNLETAFAECKTLRGVVMLEERGDVSYSQKAKDVVASCPTVAAKTVSVADVVAAGTAAVAAEHASPGAWEDTYCIMYTSGTTGDPKGVVLKNRALVSSVASAFTHFTHYGAQFTDTDSILSYLPLSHIFEQQAQALLLGCGGRVGFYTGDIKLLLDDLSALKPTVFIGVPRVYARFQERISAAVEGGSFIVKKLFEMGYARQLRAVQNPTGPEKVERSGLWDALVFKKVRGKLLPNARIAITGSAPMSPQTNDFLKVTLCCPVSQGYGLTESVGGVVNSPPGHSKSGTCGGPLPGVRVKLMDLPEMNYMNSDKPNPRGEICIKASSLLDGYYKNPEATKEAIDADGYFHTGDVGMWLPDGSLQIIDRAKNLFKLSQGEYVSPESIEGELVKAKLVGQIFVYGNSLHSTLLAVVVPDIPAAKAWAEENATDVASSDVSQIAAHPSFKPALLAEMKTAAVNAKLKKYEYIKNCIIETSDLNELGQGFHVDNDLMTPSFKLRRPQLSNKYKPALDALYE